MKSTPALRKVRRPILIEGLPGLGNVGKLVVDILTEELKAKRVMRIPLPTPGAVLVQPNNLVRFPEMALYHARVKRQEFLFLGGEAQPPNERAAHGFCDELIDILEELDARAVLTLGGIGLQQEPAQPRVFVTGNDRPLIKEFVAAGAKGKIHGVVGPILGVTGILLGKRLPAAGLLAECNAHTMLPGLRGAQAIIDVLGKRFNFSISATALEEGIQALNAMEQAPAGDLPRQDTSYIG